MIQLLIVCILFFSCTKEEVKHYNQGVALKEQGKPDKAIAQFKETIQLNPLYTEAHKEYMDIMLQQGKKAEILEEYQAKVQQHPDSEVYHYLLGRVLDDIDDQLFEFKKALEINPNYPWGHYGLGHVYFSKGMLSKAIAEYNKVIKIQPNHAAAHYNLGLVYYNQDIVSEAISEYKTTIKIKPNYADAHFNLGNIYTKQGKVSEAIEKYKTTIRVNPNYADAHYNLAVLYEKEGNFSSAIEEYKSAIRINPNDAAAHYNLKKVYQREGKSDK